MPHVAHSAVALVVLMLEVATWIGVVRHPIMTAVAV